MSETRAGKKRRKTPDECTYVFGSEWSGEFLRLHEADRGEACNKVYLAQYLQEKHPLSSQCRRQSDRAFSLSR